MEDSGCSNVSSVQILMGIAKGPGVPLKGCQMTIDVMGLQQEHFKKNIKISPENRALFIFWSSNCLNFYFHIH
ncbi:DsrE/DsrF/DrsH-like family protein [Paenibacillus vulneris]|uniref:DsrE/DsrF/DrsH-like family protein n=1 Tax=Paenibacillus vulneris TaxID=1133364 RepID=A0ABW3UVA9_9BACL